MKPQVSNERKRKAAAYRALPVAKVIRPLKYILSRHTETHIANGIVTKTPDAFAVSAMRFAKRGQGRLVHSMALASI